MDLQIPQTEDFCEWIDTISRELCKGDLTFALSALEDLKYFLRETDKLRDDEALRNIDGCIVDTSIAYLDPDG